MEESRRSPGRWFRIFVTVLAAVPVALWSFWSSGEFYWEGWGLPMPEPFFYLIPGLAFTALGLIGVTWPRLGGWVLLALGAAFGAWVLSIQLGRGAEMDVSTALGWFAVLGIPVLTGVLFLVEGRRRRHDAAPRTFWRRHGDKVAIMGIPIAVFAAFSVYWLPVVTTRYDDGWRGITLIRNERVALEWAPEGPGWNWQQDFGGYPSWASLALYGVDPVGLEDKASLDASASDMATTGLCGYLTDDGTALSAEWNGIWRMPTTAEVVASLVRDGEPAACAMDPTTGDGRCEVRPDKEAPLWVPTDSPIYLWTADLPEPGIAEYVGYNGSVGSQPIDFGNPRHGYRCVRTPIAD